ncbi:MAG: hypothetical protein ACPGYV_10405, partial [Phycisphaeraceae bacterium]
ALEREVLIESLVAPATQAKDESPGAARASDSASPAASTTPPPPSETDNVLADLTGETPPAPESEKPKSPPATPAKPTDAKPDADKGVIDDLLNG